WSSAVYALSRPVIRATLVSSSPVVLSVRLPPCAQSQKVAAAFASTIVQTSASASARRRGSGMAATRGSNATSSDMICIAAADAGVERVEAVAEDAGVAMRDERVLAAPAGAVHGVVRVEVDEPAEAVGRGAVAGRVEAVHRRAPVREAAEQILEAAAVDPVHT